MSLFTSEQSRILKNSKICFMVPCYGGAVFEQFFVSFMRSVIDFQGNGLKFGLETVSNESLVTRARNTLIAKAMSNKTNTHFMFIDADVSFTVKDIWNLVVADKPIICGLYPKKAYPIEFVYDKLNDKDQPDEQGLLKVKQAGTGFMLIKREVIEKMFTYYHHLWYRSNLHLDPAYDPYMYSLFDTSISDDKIYLSEDYTFCKRWRDMGEDIWVNTQVKLGHSGYHTFNKII